MCTPKDTYKEMIDMKVKQAQTEAGLHREHAELLLLQKFGIRVEESDDTVSTIINDIISAAVLEVTAIQIQTLMIHKQKKGITDEKRREDNRTDRQDW